MATTPGLTEIQMQAIALLADGVSQVDTAKAVGCNRVTVNRWAQKNPTFAAELAAEVERRKQRLETGLKDAADTKIDKQIAEVRSELAEFHQALINVQKARLQRGKVLMDKVYRRLLDLPEEAISVKDIAPLMTIADRLFEKGLETWGDAIALDDIMMRMGSDESQ